jgi:hypothetical protein
MMGSVSPHVSHGMGMGGMGGMGGMEGMDGMEGTERGETGGGIRTTPESEDTENPPTMEDKIYQYHLSKELSSTHGSAVCALALSTTGDLLSGSRDRVLSRSRTAGAAGGITDLVGIVTDHPHWVNCIIANGPGNGFVTGSVSSFVVWAVVVMLCWYNLECSGVQSCPLAPVSHPSTNPPAPASKTSLPFNHLT